MTTIIATATASNTPSVNPGDSNIVNGDFLIVPNRFINSNDTIWIETLEVILDLAEIQNLPVNDTQEITFNLLGRYE
jgi:hypothetical protein